MNIDLITRVTMTAAVDSSQRLYTVQKLDNPQNSQAALIVTVLVKFVEFSDNGQGRVQQEYRHLLYKPHDLESGMWRGTWCRLCRSGLWNWEVTDQLPDSLVVESDLISKLRAFLSNHDVAIID